MGETAYHQNDLAQAAQINYLTPENTRFTETKGKMLDCVVDGKHYSSVFLHCSFPHTDRQIFVSVRTLKNKEIGMIKRVTEFPKETVELLEHHIRLRYFSPEISTINRIKEEFGYSYWDVETSAGRCYFTVRNGRGNVAMITDEQALIADVDGNRFLIKDIHQLTDKEYRMVEMLFV